MNKYTRKDDVVTVTQSQFEPASLGKAEAKALVKECEEYNRYKDKINHKLLRRKGIKLFIAMWLTGAAVLLVTSYLWWRLL